MNSLTNRTEVLTTPYSSYRYFPLKNVEGADSLPLALKVLLENVLRNVKDDSLSKELQQRIVSAGQDGEVGKEVEFCPARVLFQDFTGVPIFVDFAVMREACVSLGLDPLKINPQIPCDLVIDHSVIADKTGEGALKANCELEFMRNKERYAFLKWAQQSFENVRIVPPGAGICHQLNIEKFAHVVMTSEAAHQEGIEGMPVAYFDTLVGADSHTPTANGLGILGWGVGGIEAEAAALGQPITTLVPRVVGVRITGSLKNNAQAMDVALTLAQKLREKGVVGSFVECFGPGLENLSATQRACISNMTPEYGSTCTLFPVDQQTLRFMEETGRSKEDVSLIEAYAKAQGFWHNPDENSRTYADILELNLDEVVPSMSGPSRPHDRFDFKDASENFARICNERNLDMEKYEAVEINNEDYKVTHGAIAIAAVTSCTTATDPRMMITCGLLAKHAAQAGISPKPWVKCVFAPGSHATSLLLERADLINDLEHIGYSVCGYGCMSCIGNSGPVLPAMHDVCNSIELASVLSGNRNFEGRISADVSQNYLMAPSLVLAYAFTGSLDFDFETTPLGINADGKEIYLSDIWPQTDEVEELLDKVLDKDIYEQGSLGMFEGSAEWQNLDAPTGDVFNWDEASTYVRPAPYFIGMEKEPTPRNDLQNARVLALLGDFITTDHISPASAIPADSPAAQYLRNSGVPESLFNTYGARRGNHEVMMRGTFGNVKLQNRLTPGKTGGWSLDFDSGQVKPLFDVAMEYEEANIPAIILAGKMYGSGSSRDWAAKGPMLLGVKAVIAESFERIHRSNLIGMGVLPLQFKENDSIDSLGLDGSETFDIAFPDFSAGLPVPKTVQVIAAKSDKTTVTFDVDVRVDTPTEGFYLYNGGILQYVLRALN